MSKEEKDTHLIAWHDEPGYYVGPISVEEYRVAQLDMLDKLARFCDLNGVRYYLSGGTLLGAIRHEGYIPWDDDIDLNMPRPDYEMLQKLSRGSIGDYQLVGPVYRTTFPRLYDSRYIIENFYGGECQISSLY